MKWIIVIVVAVIALLLGLFLPQWILAVALMILAGVIAYKRIPANVSFGNMKSIFTGQPASGGQTKW